jgi:imidazolonepropionase-like amidohydrolase
VDRAKKAGAICLKVFYEPGFGGAANWPVFSPKTLAALRAEATRQGLVMVVHANAVESWRAALDAHADVIAHGLWQWGHYTLDVTPPPEARQVINAVAAAHIAVQPTLQVVYGDLAIFDKSLLNDPRFAEALPRSVVEYLKSDEGQKAQRAQADEYRQAIAAHLGKDTDPAKAMAVAAKRATATLRMMVEENVKLLFGSDTPSNEGIGNPPGLNGRLEMNRWDDAGVPLSRILRAATMDNATAFGMSDRGTIEVGKRADLLLLRENPLKTIKAYDAIETVIVNGNPIAPATLLAKE